MNAKPNVGNQSPNHPWRMRRNKQCAKLVKKREAKDVSKWTCPQCGDPKCEHAECLPGDF